MNSQETAELLAQIWVDGLDGDAEGFWGLMKKVLTEIDHRIFMKENVKELKNEHLATN